MGDFSLYQWLVLGLLSWIAFGVTVIVYAGEASSLAMTVRIEAAIKRACDEIQRQR